ncbi:hypothetical protein, partial [Streptococcus suis]|uniref:hypothetical protein n=1 Tax=Streptococcus suis TaxID=1307 RepID=UPI00211C4627
MSVRKIFHDPFKVILSLAPAIRRRSSLTASARLDHLGGLDAAWLENVAKKLKQSGLITPHLGAKIAASALIVVSSAVLTLDWARAEPAFEANHEVQLEELSVTGQGGGARTPEGYAPATTISATRTETP